MSDDIVSRRSLADFLEAHRTEFVEMVRSTMPHEKHGEALVLLGDLLHNEVARLRGEATHTGEVMANFVARERARGENVHDALRRVQKVRDLLIRYCLGQVPGIDDQKLYEMVVEAHDYYSGFMVRLHEEEDQRVLATERRRGRIIAEAIERPFALLDGEGRIVFSNTALADVLEVPAESLAGREFPLLCDAEAATAVRRNLHRKRATATEEFLGALLTPKGVSIPRQFAVTPLFAETGLRSGAAVTAGAPRITDKHRKWELSIVGELADTVELGLYLLNDAYKAVYANGWGAKLQGACDEDKRSQGPACGEHALDDGRCGTCLARGLFDKTALHRETICLEKASGNKQYYEVCCTPFIDEEQNTKHIVKVVRDVTHSRTLEHQVLRQQRTSLVSQLAMTVAHRLRNPLGVVIGYAELLDRGMPAGEAGIAVDKVLRHGLRCKQIVETLLEFGKELPGERVRVNVPQLIMNQVQPMYPASVVHNIEWELDRNLPPVECSPSQIAQVCTNVIDNALAARKARVSVETSLGLDDKTVRVRVLDDGPPIAPEVKEQMFEPFFTTRDKEGHIGLGLSLCQMVMQEHQGALFLDEGVNNSTCFIVELPVAEESVSTTDSERLEEDSESKTTRRRVLIVDDEQDLVDMLAMALETRGDKVDTATTAPQALALLRESAYDLAVLDILLSEDVGGPELHEIIQSSYPDLAQRTMFITADTMNYETRRFLDDVKLPFLEKPFLLSDFMETIDSLAEIE